MYNLFMRKFLFVLIILCISLSVKSGYVFAFDKCGQDCMKCHSLNSDDATEVLKGLIPDVKVLDVRQAPLKGLWEVAIEAGGRKNIIYLDFSKKKVIAGNLVDIKTRTNYTQESFQRINKVDFSSIPLDKSVIMGDKDAKYKVIVFDDPE
jgi:thiol:disulfide interchange protein DsbC